MLLEIIGMCDDVFFLVQSLKNDLLLNIKLSIIIIYNVVQID